ncbi:MAG: amidohydrolase family protein [Planctomycetota bacterium]
MEAARAAGTAEDSRHRITHVTLVSPSDVPRFAAQGVTADFQMADDSVFPDRFQKVFGPFLGGARVRQEALRLRSLYDAGARVVLSSDYDVGGISPFAGMQRALTRGPESLPSLAAAIRAFTIEPAWRMRKEDRTGTLEKGKLADIIVLDRGLFRIPPSQLGATKVLLTLLEGETVWRAPGF